MAKKTMKWLVKYYMHGSVIKTTSHATKPEAHKAMNGYRTSYTIPERVRYGIETSLSKL